MKCPVPSRPFCRLLEHTQIALTRGFASWCLQGHQLYYGPAQKVHMWFDQLGAPCPERVSIADFILDLASDDVVIGDR